MPKIVAVGHHKNVGKDAFVRSCINILRPQLRNKRIVRRGFADKLYDFCYATYGWAGFQPLAYYQDNPKAKNTVLIPLGRTVREVLIEVGNHMRKYDNDIWLNANLLAKDYDILFVNDMRFPNELKAVLDNGGIAIKLNRPGLPVPTDEADTALNGVETWHHTFNNDGDLNNLHNFAEHICNSYLLN